MNHNFFMTFYQEGIAGGKEKLEDECQNYMSTRPYMAIQKEKKKVFAVNGQRGAVVCH